MQTDAVCLVCSRQISFRCSQLAHTTCSVKNPYSKQLSDDNRRMNQWIRYWFLLFSCTRSPLCAFFLLSKFIASFNDRLKSFYYCKYHRQTNSTPTQSPQHNQIFIFNSTLFMQINLSIVDQTNCRRCVCFVFFLNSVSPLHQNLSLCQFVFCFVLFCSSLLLFSFCAAVAAAVH